MHSLVVPTHPGMGEGCSNCCAWEQIFSEPLSPPPGKDGGRLQAAGDRIHGADFSTEVGMPSSLGDAKDVPRGEDEAHHPPAGKRRDHSRGDIAAASTNPSPRNQALLSSPIDIHWPGTRPCSRDGLAGVSGGHGSHYRAASPLCSCSVSLPPGSGYRAVTKHQPSIIQPPPCMLVCGADPQGGRQ